MTLVYSSNAFCLEKGTGFMAREGAQAGIKSQAAEPWSVQRHLESLLVVPHGQSPMASPRVLQRARTALTTARELSAVPGTLIPALRSDPHPETDPVLPANRKTVGNQVRTG